jgi:hypothetical protein
MTLTAKLTETGRIGLETLLLLREVEFDFIHKAPAPVLPGLDRPHDRVLSAVKMLRCVLVLGGVAAADVPALHAQAKVHPGIAHLQALFAALGVRCHFVNVALMCAIAHVFPPQSE